MKLFFGKMSPGITGGAKEAIDMDKQIKEKPKTNIKKLVVILLLFFVVTIIMAIAVPSMVIYRPKSYCGRVEGDAMNIRAVLSDYFSDPAHTDLNIKPDVLADTEYVENPWSLAASGDNIFIHVVDRSGKCPAEYQKRYPEWHSGIYTLKFLD